MLKLFTVLFLTKLFCRSASKFLNTSAKFFFSWLSLPAENVLIPILTTTWKKITEIRYAPLTHAQYNYKIYRTHSHPRTVSFSLDPQHKTRFVRVSPSSFPNDKRKGAFAPSGALFRCLSARPPTMRVCMLSNSYKRVRVP